jgi:hypothetical protein
MNPRASGGSFQLGRIPRCGKITEGYILRSRCLVRYRPLKENCNHPAQVLEWKVTDIAAIERNATGLGIIKSTQQLQQRALAGTVRAYDSHDLTGWNRNPAKLVSRFPDNERRPVESKYLLSEVAAQMLGEAALALVAAIPKIRINFQEKACWHKSVRHSLATNGAILALFEMLGKRAPNHRESLFLPTHATPHSPMQHPML